MRKDGRKEGRKEGWKEGGKGWNEIEWNEVEGIGREWDNDCLEWDGSMNEWME